MSKYLVTEDMKVKYNIDYLTKYPIFQIALLSVLHLEKK